MGVYKVNVSLPEDLVSRIDETAAELGLSRSGFIAEAASRYIVDVENLTAEERRRRDIERAIAGFRRIGAEAPPGTGERMMRQLRIDRERDTPPEGRR